MRRTLPREAYIPRKSIKIADKHSDAIAYVYDVTKANGQLRYGAALFIGQQAKPLWHYTFSNTARREHLVAEAFTNRRKYVSHVATRKIEAKEKAVAFAKTIEVGDIFHYSYGYDETHHFFVQVVKVKGKSVWTRHIQQAQEDLGYDWRHVCMPQSDAFTDEASRHLIQDGYIRIGDHWASRWNTETIGGVKMGPAYIGGGGH